MFRQILLAAMAVGIAGCAGVPPPPVADGIEVERIVDAVQCELASVYILNPKYAPYVRDWLARATLELKVTNDSSYSPTITVTPSLTTNLTVPIGPDLQDQSIRNAVITFDVHLRDVQPNKYLTKKPSCPYEYSGLPQALGTLGLGDWLSTIATAAGRPDAAALHEATYDLEFTVARGAHGGITFQNVHVNVDAGGAKLLKTNYNHLVVAFTYDPAPASTPSHKAKASPEASFRLDSQIQRFLPQRFIIQNSNGLVVR
jgi:hypothetical protein